MLKKIINVVILFLIYCSLIIAQSEEEKIFAQKCAVCHSIGGGKLVGPGLANIDKRRTEEWLIKFIKSSQSMINSGDSTAVALFEAYNKLFMPDQDLTDNQIRSVIAYISSVSSDINNQDVVSTTRVFNASSITQTETERGKKLFTGELKFKMGGPSCISCHNINNLGVFNGGLLARDLTNSFSRLNAIGIDGILRNPPFPAMIDGFGKRSLTDEEIKNLLAFLYYIDLQGPTQLSSLQSQIVLLIGIIIILNLVFFVLFYNWQKVKKYTVN